MNINAYNSEVINHLLNAQNTHFNDNGTTDDGDNDLWRSKFINDDYGGHWLSWDDTANKKGIPIISSPYTIVRIFVNGKPYSDRLSSYKPQKGDTVINLRHIREDDEWGDEGKIDVSALNPDQKSEVGAIKAYDTKGNLLSQDYEMANTPISTDFYNELAAEIKSTPVPQTKVINNTNYLPDLNQDNNISKLVYPSTISSNIKVTGETTQQELDTLKGLQYTSPQTVITIPTLDVTPLSQGVPLKSLLPTFTVNSNYQIQQLSHPKNGYTLKDLYPDSELLAGTGSNRYIDCDNGNGILIQTGKTRSSNDPEENNDTEYLDNIIGTDTYTLSASGASNDSQSIQNGLMYPGEVLALAPVQNGHHLHIIDVKTGIDITNMVAGD